MITRKHLLALASTTCIMLTSSVMQQPTQQPIQQVDTTELTNKIVELNNLYGDSIRALEAEQSLHAETQFRLSAAEARIVELTTPKEFSYCNTATPIPTYNLPLSEDLQRYTYLVCEAYGIADKYDLVLALMWQESDFVVDVISDTDDYGLMQINKINHSMLSETLYIYDFLVPENNIHAGIYILSGLLEDYSGDEQKALVAYNMGPDGADALWSHGIYSTNYSRGILDKRTKLNSYPY